jgi:hypothetical protein
MAFRIQKISDYGASNPICARLTLQLNTLFEFCNISKRQKEDIFGIMLQEVVPKLMACFRIKEELTKEIREHQKKIDENGLEFQAQGRAYTLPSIMDLRHHTETFLYNAKSALRDFTVIFQIFFAKDFQKKAHYNKVLKWAEQKFGRKDRLSKMLAEDAMWITQIIKMRNAVEHPDRNILHIENFTSIENGKTVLVVEPVWYLNSEKQSPIARDMEVYVSNLLTFFEESLLLCVEKFPSGFPVAFAEIPEADRDSKCPVRFRVVLTVEGPKPPTG